MCRSRVVVASDSDDESDIEPFPCLSKSHSNPASRLKKIPKSASARPQKKLALPPLPPPPPPVIFRTSASTSASSLDTQPSFIISEPHAALQSDCLPLLNQVDLSNSGLPSVQLDSASSVFSAQEEMPINTNQQTSESMPQTPSSVISRPASAAKVLETPTATVTDSTERTNIMCNYFHIFYLSSVI